MAGVVHLVPPVEKTSDEVTEMLEEALRRAKADGALSVAIVIVHPDRAVTTSHTRWIPHSLLGGLTMLEHRIVKGTDD